MLAPLVFSQQHPTQHCDRALCSSQNQLHISKHNYNVSIRIIRRNVVFWRKLRLLSAPCNAENTVDIFKFVWVVLFSFSVCSHLSWAWKHRTELPLMFCSATCPNHSQYKLPPQMFLFHLISPLSSYQVLAALCQIYYISLVVFPGYDSFLSCLDFFSPVWVHIRTAPFGNVYLFIYFYWNNDFIIRDNNNC